MRFYNNALRENYTRGIYILSSIDNVHYAIQFTILNRFSFLGIAQQSFKTINHVRRHINIYTNLTLSISRKTAALYIALKPALLQA